VYSTQSLLVFDPISDALDSIVCKFPCIDGSDQSQLNASKIIEHSIVDSIKLIEKGFVHKIQQ
jgi:hypothetical protein